MKGEYVIIRSKNAGVFAGTLKEEKGETVILTNARRIWYWDGAATLSQLAMEGTKKPENCKFPCEVEEIKIKGVCEIIKCTQKAKESISGVAVWEY